MNRCGLLVGKEGREDNNICYEGVKGAEGGEKFEFLIWC